jgi:hypothetical protein
MRATCPAHHIRLDLTCLMISVDEYKSRSSSLCKFLHSPVTSSLLGPNILLRTLFSNTFSLYSSLSVRDQVSHPYKTTGRIVVLYITLRKENKLWICEISSSHGGEYEVQNCSSRMMRQYAPLKRRSTIILHGSTSQKTILKIKFWIFSLWIFSRLPVTSYLEESWLIFVIGSYLFDKSPWNNTKPFCFLR